MTRWMTVSGLCLVGLLAGCGPSVESTPAGAEAAASTAGAVPTGRVAPRFEVDPLWPKPLPNHGLIGSTIGVTVDARDHVWIIHRPETLNEREAKAGGFTRPASVGSRFVKPREV